LDLDFNRALADAARQLADEKTMATTLDRVVVLCTEILQQCDCASLSVVEQGQIRTLAASDEVLNIADKLQLEHGEGPCLGALEETDRVIAGDLAADDRWPVWGPAVVTHVGVRSILSHHLPTDGGSMRVLSLYSERADAFTHEDLDESEALAAHASVALGASLKEAQLTRALESRTVIGQATGILIERFGLDAEKAFAVMRRVSQNHNIKLHELATHLVETGVLLHPKSLTEDHDPSS
jgi:transcriptional regulator with GAF, ATPase, and Fis domain